jgi:prevent-host-death family protein
MKKIEATQARQQFSDTVNRVAYGGDRIVVSRRGKKLAAIVPVDDLDLIKRCEEEEALKSGVRERRKHGGQPRKGKAKGKTKAGKRYAA